MSDTEFQRQIKELREQTGLNRKDFCEKYQIPYRTMTDWELGNRTAPDYVMRLMAYYIRMEMGQKGDKNVEE